MAVRTSFTAGEVLAAADLTDTFNSKPKKTTASGAPGSPATGDLWFDTTTSPAIAKFWDGSAWQTFSAGAANFSNSATGTYTDGGVNYKYITFTGSGSLIVTKTGFADVLVVGGGGGGGTPNVGAGTSYGGGGSGGYLELNSVYLAATSHTVVIGAGGATQSTAGGTDSLIGNFICAGGGTGGSLVLAASDFGFQGINGGSGGGGMSSSLSYLRSGGRKINGLGNIGGNGFNITGSTSGGGGGGGATAAGGNGASATGGNGGAGASSSITGSAVTRGGGGGGGGFTTAGSGGSGGGGAGGTNASNAGTAGTANTGGGGGGTYQSSSGAAGGSGVVIIRVKV